MSVGNDVVDLDDVESRLGGLHPRWSERVFSAAEAEQLQASRSRHRLHWALWAAKESAYKARRRLDPAAVFSPREFEVELPDLPPAGDAEASGRVVHQGDAFSLEVQVEGSRVHAVATSEDEGGAPVLWRVEPTDGDPRLAVRRLAAGAIARALARDPAGVAIVGRPPVATFEDGRADIALSLSHHGRFVAFACTLSGAIRAQHDRRAGVPLARQCGEATAPRPPGKRAFATSAL